MPARQTHVAPTPRTSRIVRDNPYRPVRRMRTLPPRHVRRASCATIHIAPCAQGARYVRMMVRPRHVRRALCATIHTAPCAECARYHRMMLPPRHVRRASCATIHTAPCAQGARYARVTYVAHPARQSISRRAQNAHATSAPCTSRIVRDNPHRAVRPRRTLQINRTLSPKMATFISIYLYYYSDVMQ